jgi:hypothetical protein
MSPLINAIKRNFTGGEVAPTFESRDDVAKYSSACRVMENFIPQVHGGAYFRGGLQLVGELPAPFVVIPFAFNTDPEDTYALCFYPGKLRIAQGFGMVIDSSSVVVEVDTPFTVADLYKLRYTQSADVVYLSSSGAHPLHKLTRLAHDNWTLATVAFTPDVSAPTGGAGTWHGTASSFTLRYVVTSVTNTGKESVGSSPVEIAGAKYATDWTEGEYVSLTWGAVTDAVEYNIYKEDGGRYGFVGTAKTTTFRDDNYSPDMSDSPQAEYLPFADGNHPHSLALHMQRLWVGGAAKNPRTLYASRIGDLENFNKSFPLQDDDSLELPLDTSDGSSSGHGSVSVIQWLCPFSDLLLGTAAGEYKIAGAGGSGPVTAGSNEAKPQSHWGSADISPLVIGDSMLTMTRHRTKVRDLFFSLEKDGYAGNDLSILAAHLFQGYKLISWAYQSEPDSVVWAVRDDGLLLGFTYHKEHEIWGWFRAPTKGRVLSVATVPADDVNEDALYVAVEREIQGVKRYFLERLSPKWRERQGLEKAVFLDSSLSYSGEAKDTFTGLDHLEGETVAAFADGDVVENLVVTGGSVTLPRAAGIVHIGLPYSGALAPLPVEMDTNTGSSQGKVRALGQVHLRFAETVGGRVGTSPENASEIKYEFNIGAAVEVFTGTVTCSLENGVGPSPTVYVVQDRPRPMTVMAIIETVAAS